MDASPITALLSVVGQGLQRQALGLSFIKQRADAVQSLVEVIGQASAGGNVTASRGQNLNLVA
ncbi:MAG: hypothetical protein GC168_18620 [Candidatus Hydrogenedens sp.]|nr:hypothetical protein [Candidatus Hydrogenedens sp.]